MVKFHLGLPGIPIPPCDSIFSLIEIFSSPHLTVPVADDGLVESMVLSVEEGVVPVAGGTSVVLSAY